MHACMHACTIALCTHKQFSEQKALARQVPRTRRATGLGGGVGFRALNGQIEINSTVPWVLELGFRRLFNFAILQFRVFKNTLLIPGTTYDYYSSGCWYSEAPVLQTPKAPLDSGSRMKMTQVNPSHTVDDTSPALSIIRNIPQFPWFRVLKVFQQPRNKKGLFLGTG